MTDRPAPIAPPAGTTSGELLPAHLHRRWLEGKPVMHRLSEAKVVEFCLTPARCIAFWERCDDTFVLELAPAEVRALAAELLAAADEAEALEPSERTPDGRSDG